IGEETGRLPAMLEEAADDLEEKVQDRMTTLVALLEPAMIVGLALLAGFLVIAMFLPIVGVIEGLSG
ncbi:MAG TPA: type II secretion system F family protein, partial [Opitutales bacterium]|nr:type II secretion system F family protein [Opitutales bacterium]